MSLAARGQRRSIGEVLALLKSEFPDISISKIRFLEGQGLLKPERTDSGYRKFGDTDVARLRYILRLQREQFLPLKVIKDRLLEQEAADGGSNGGGAAPSDLPPGHPFGAHVSRKDLLADTGLQEAQLRDLEKFGMVSGQTTREGVWYGSEAIEVARLAARFLATGVEVRHLRVFKTTVDREADLYRQMAPPTRNAKSPQARAEASARLEELSDLGQALRTELLRQVLSDS